MDSLGLMMRLVAIFVTDIQRGVALMVRLASIKSVLIPFCHVLHAWLRWRRAC